MILEQINFGDYAPGKLVSEKISELKTQEQIEIIGFEELSQLRTYVRDTQQALLNIGSKIPYTHTSCEENLKYMIKML